MIIAVTRPDLTKQPFNPYMNPYGQPMQPPYPPNQQYGMGSQPMQSPYPPNEPYGQPYQPPYEPYEQPAQENLLDIRCTSCGTLNPPDSTTCSHCGEKLY